MYVRVERFLNSFPQKQLILQILHAVPLAHLDEHERLSYVVRTGRSLIERYRRIPLKKYRLCAFMLLAAITYATPGSTSGLNSLMIPL